jgi:hypothetical protein
MLREAEVLINQSLPVAEVCRTLQVSEQTYYRGREEYGGTRVEGSNPPASFLFLKKIQISVRLH